MRVQSVRWVGVLFTLTFDSSPIKEIFEKLSVSGFCGFQRRFSASEGFSNVWKRPPDASFRRRSPVSEAAAHAEARSVDSLTHAAVAEAECPHAAGCTP